MAIVSQLLSKPLQRDNEDAEEEEYYSRAAGGYGSSSAPAKRPSGLSWRRKLRMARDAAAAIAYLHSFDPPYLHRDVKSQARYHTFVLRALSSCTPKRRTSSFHAGST
jgi:hypothetical protein